METMRGNSWRVLGFTSIGAAMASVMGYLAVGLTQVDSGWSTPRGVDRLMDAYDAGKLTQEQGHAAAMESLRIRPIDGRPYRVLAFEALENGDVDRYQQLLKIAVRRAPRDRITRAAMMDLSFEQGNYFRAFENMDALLRDAPDFVNDIAPRLVPALANDEILTALSERLSTQPPWRNALISALARTPQGTTYAKQLMASGASRVEDDAGLMDPGFEGELGEGPFAWQIPNVPGVETTLDEVAPLAGRKSLKMSFQGRAVQFGGATQMLALKPGRYRMEILSKDETNSIRPFAWVLRCDIEDDHSEVYRAEFGASDGRGEVSRKSHVVSVPNHCSRQRLQLNQLARTLQERQVQGSLWTEIGNFSQLSP